MSGISALKGFRTQFLYTLHYILSHQIEEYLFHLEGKEDLDVLDKEGKPLFCIQVKNLSDTVTLSDILKKDKDSFLKRFITLYPDSIPVLVSYGNVSRQIENFKSGAEQITPHEKKQILDKYKIKAKDWELTKRKLEVEKVNESTLIEEIIQLLSTSFPFNDPIPTAKLLLQWLSTIAEEQKIISIKDLVAEVEGIAKYLSERLSIAHQYGVVLKPLHQISSTEANSEKLQEEFYYGISARFQHILSNLDVIRTDLLSEIDTLFTQSNVVVIHGASGQGKSALAYRYIHDHAPSELLYELNLQESPLESAQSIYAVATMAKNIHTPIFFLIHVQPNTTEWLKIVKEFAANKGLRFLITVREEDWFRAATTGIDFIYKDIALSLSKVEAKEIYERLNEKRQILEYSSFDELWLQSGQDIPLLEFVHVITKGTPLRDRLKQQVLQIQQEVAAHNNDKMLKVLRLVSLADSYGAKIDIQRFKKFGEIQFILERFEKEYLLKQTDDKKYIVGLHPVRSNIIKEYLFDEFSTLEKEYLFKLLPFIDDRDVYYLLIQFFSKDIIRPEEFLKSINSEHILSWVSYLSIMKGLLWAGLRDYTISSRPIFDKFYTRFEDGWMLALDFDFSNTFIIEDFFNSSSQIAEETKQFVRTLNSQLPDRSSVFVYSILFVRMGFEPARIPESPLEWQSLGETLFWWDYFPNCTKPNIQIIETSAINKAFHELSTEPLSKLMFGMFHYSQEYNNLRLQNASIFLNKMQEQFRTPSIRINERDIIADYIIDIVNDRYDKDNSFNARSMTIINILRYAFPDMERYCTQAHGHRLQMIPDVHDESIKAIQAKNLPFKELVQINTIIIQLFNYPKKVKNWIDFHTELHKWEEAVAEYIRAFNQLIKLVVKSNFFHKKDASSFSHLFNKLNYTAFQQLEPPQPISDNLGIYSKPIIKSKETSTKATTIYDDFFQSYKDYKMHIENFIEQSKVAIESYLLHIKIADHNRDAEKERLSIGNLYLAIKKFGIFHQLKEKYFSKYIPHKANYIKEEELFVAAVLWNSLLYADKAPRIKDAIGAMNKIESIKKKIESSFKRKCIELSKAGDYTIEYLNNSKTGNKPVFRINAINCFNTDNAEKDTYNLVQEVIKDLNDASIEYYASIEYLIHKMFYPQFYLLTTIHDFTINNKWIEIPLHTIRDTAYHDLTLTHCLYRTIDSTITEQLQLREWSTLIPDFLRVRGIFNEFITMRGLIEHTIDLEGFSEIATGEEETAQQILHTHLEKIGKQIGTIYSLVFNYLPALGENHVTVLLHSEYEKKHEYATLFIRICEYIRDETLPTTSGSLTIEALKRLLEKVKVLHTAFNYLTKLHEDWLIYKYLHDKGTQG